MATVVKDLKQAQYSHSNQKNSLTDIWQNLLENHSTITAVVDRYNDFNLTYKELYEVIKQFSAGLQSLGLNKGDHICLFSENSSKWLISDQAILMAGGADAVRGSQTPVEELFYIIEHSDSRGIVVENMETVAKLLPYLADYPLKFIICLSGEEIPDDIKFNHNVYSFNQVMNLGKNNLFNPVEISKADIATLVYTSGTTGMPKGVMITHGNLLSQLESLSDTLEIYPGDTALNVLPTWHIYERTCEYYLLSGGMTLNYTNVANFKDDIKEYKPNYLVAVPRIWEALHNGIYTELRKQPVLKQKIIKFLIKTGEAHIKSSRILNNLCIDNINCSITKKIEAFAKFYLTYPLHKLGEKIIFQKIRSALGGNFRQGISGGGALAGYLEDFYEAIGISIVVGYGLTETSPVLTIRKRDYNIKKSAGKPILNTEIKIIHPDNHQKLGYLRTGIVMARGPQVMQGYYKDIEATNKVLSPDGWFNTGDLGWLTPQNDLVLTGRNKDVIVLSNGENVEPQPLEDACLTSPYIHQIVLVGQDKSHLGALISPNIDTLQSWAEKQSLKYADDSHIYNCPKINKLFKKELMEYIQKRPNCRPFEKINKFKLVKEPFTVENGLLTPTMKIKKNEVQKKYQNLIEELYKIN